jgi:alpha-1,6-mannosyltransferase
VSPDATVTPPVQLERAAPAAAPPALRLVAAPPPRVVDVAMFYGERGGGIRSYIDAKAAWAVRSGAIEHHVVVPGRAERHIGARHELPSAPALLANGYRVPLGTRALRRTLAQIEPDIVVLHDPFWGPRGTAQAARAAGARVVAVHHGSAALDAASVQVDARVTVPALRAWMRRAAREADLVMAAVDTRADLRRGSDLPLRLGVDAAFRPQPGVARGDHVLCVGRLGREKGVLELLEAAARSRDPWPLRFAGAGPLEDLMRARANQLGIAHRVSIVPYVRDRARLARMYASAACVVMPGRHETFGLVALEAAASGARVVACSTAPSAAVVGALAVTFAPGDGGGLVYAIEQARAQPADHEAAARLASASTWESVFETEMRDLAGRLR